jgi:hypothetical protein
MMVNGIKFCSIQLMAHVLKELSKFEFVDASRSNAFLRCRLLQQRARAANASWFVAGSADPTHSFFARASDKTIYFESIFGLRSNDSAILSRAQINGVHCGNKASKSLMALCLFVR